jgi:hypothetical protein
MWDTDGMVKCRGRAPNDSPFPRPHLYSHLFTEAIVVNNVFQRAWIRRMSIVERNQEVSKLEA